MSAERPRLTLCMIVRDEADNLERCLRSVESVVDEIVIIDTGSTDETIEIARRFGARVESISWEQDFARARNAGLELAHGEWILQLDADEELCLGMEGEELLKGLAGQECEAYILEIVSRLENGESMRHEIVRLWRNRKAYRFQGKVHEQILPSILRHNPNARVELSGLKIVHHGYSQKVRDQKVKARRNLVMLKTVVQDNPQDLFAQFNLGVSGLQLGNYEEACEVLGGVYDQLKGTESWAPSLVRAYALALERKGELDRAIDVLEQGIDLWSDYTELLYILGFIYLRKHRYSRAITAWQQCTIRGNPPSRYVSTEGVGSYLAFEQLGLLYLRLKDHSAAIKAFTDALRVKPDFSRALYHLARTLRENGHSAEQILDYMETHFHFANPSARILLADVLAQVNAVEQALRQVERALLQIQPTEAIHRFRGYLLLKLKRFEQAIGEFERITQASPEFVQTRRYICYCQWLREPPQPAGYALGQLRGAGLIQDVVVLEEYQRFLCGGDKVYRDSETLPDDVKVACGLRLAEELLDLGAPHRADIAAEMIGGLVSQRASLVLGKLFSRFGEKSRAVHWLLNGLKEGNYDAESLKILGEIAHERDLFEDAEQLFAEALSLAPDRLETHLDMAKVYLKQARRVLERGLTFVPGSTLIKEELKRVEACLKWL